MSSNVVITANPDAALWRAETFTIGSPQPVAMTGTIYTKATHTFDYAADLRDTLQRGKVWLDTAAAEKAAFVARIEALEQSLGEMRALLLSLVEQKQKPGIPASAFRSPRQDVGLKTFM
jgi:hypothetical protein